MGEVNMNDNRKWLYDALASKGVQMGAYEEFDKNVDANKEWLYDTAKKSGVNIGDYDAFDKAMSNSLTPTVAVPHPEQQQSQQAQSRPQSPYVEGKGKDTLIFGVPYNDYQQMSPEEQSRHYSAAIEKKKTDERAKLSEALGGLKGAVGDELGGVTQELKHKEADYVREHPFLSIFTGYNSEDDPRYRNLKAAKNLIDDAEKIVAEAGADKSSGLKNFGRGVRDVAFDVDTWTAGISDLGHNLSLAGVLEKANKGEELSSDEQKLLDASVINLAATAFSASDVSMGYRIGQTSANSIPFMLEFAINPISSSGNTLAKGLLKYGLKRFGKAATTKAAKVAGRLVGDATAAAGMTATSSAPRVMANAVERLNDNYTYKVDDEGELAVDKTGDVGTVEALARSGATQFLENQSEMVFNAFAGGGKMAKEALAKFIPGISKLSDTQLAQLYNSIKNNPTIKDVARRTQFHGLLGEYAEEVYNNFANIPLGEMTVEEATDLDKNVETFLSLAPTSILFSAVGLGGMARERYSAQKNLRRFTEGLSEEDKALFSELQQVINDGDKETAKEFIKRTLADENLSSDEKKERVFAVQEMEKEHVLEDVREDDISLAPEDIEANKVDIYRNFKRAERKVNSLLPGELVAQLDAVSDLRQFATTNNLDEKQVETLADYLPAKELFSQYIDYTEGRKEDAKVQAREQATADVEKISNPDTGLVSQVKHKFSEAPVYLVGGNLSFGEDGLLDRENSSETVYYLDESGERKMAPAADFDSILSEMPTTEMIAQAEVNAEQDFITAEEENLSSPDIPAPDRGETVMMNGNQYLIEGENEDAPGTLIAVKLNEAGEIDTVNGDERPISIEDYYGLKEAELWGSNQHVDNTNEEAPIVENEEVPLQEAEASPVVPTEADEVQEETPELKLQKVIENLPKKKDGSVDYKALTPQQQFDYTSVVESPEMAIEDLETDVAAMDEEIQKLSVRLSKATGGERAEIRDLIRAKKHEQEELNTFYQSVMPAQSEETPSTEESVQVPKDVRSDEDYIEWVADNSDDATEVLNAYSAAKDLASHEQTLKPWQRELLGRKISTSSFNRFGDRNQITGSLAKGWLRKDGQEIDAIAQELSENGIEVTEQDIVDFMLTNPTNHVSQISDSMRTLSSRFSEIATKEMGIPVGGPDSNTGKLYIKLKEANQKLSELNDQQKADVHNAIVADMDTSDTQRTEGYYESLDGYAQQYDQFRQELAEDEADQALIRQIEKDNPQLYHGGFTADELDEIYSQIEDNNGTERQKENSGETQSPLSGEEVEQYEKSGASEVVATENREGEEQNLKLSSTERIGSNDLNSENNSASLQEEIKPIGNGPFGAIYSQFRNKAKEAVTFLLKLKSGEAIAALHHPAVGDIDLIWGKEGTGKSNGYGLSKIAKFHPEVLSNLQEVLDDMEVISRTQNRINLESNTHKAAVRLEWDGERKNWLLTAFEKETPTPIDKTTDTGENQNDLQSDTALLQDVGAPYADKDSKQTINKQENTQFITPQLVPNENVLDYANRISESKRLFDAEQEVNTNPTEAQKSAGNYKKGHIKIDGYDITIENPKGSERSGVDANGKSWSVTMNNSYGYIRGTEGVDGDHIDVFLSDHPAEGKVYVIDQVNEDGSFDEHKVMYGFNSALSAKNAYEKNYSPGWQGLGKITEVSKEVFNEWVKSSKRKTKPFSEYKIAKKQANIIHEVEQPATVDNNNTERPTEDYGATNKLVSKDRYEELKNKLRGKLGQMNVGFDPELFAIGAEMAAYHIEAGARKFADFAQRMVADIGDGVRPYLKSFYEGARQFPGMERYENEMDEYQVVKGFDTESFDRIESPADNDKNLSAKDNETNRRKSSTKMVSSQNEGKSKPAEMRDMFNQIDEDNGPQQGSETENHSVGGSAREETGGLHQRGMDRSHSGNNEFDKDGGRGISESPDSTSTKLDSAKKNTHNNRNGRGIDYAPSSPKARFEANVAAIKLMRNLMERGETIPSAKEMQTLRKYSGWGGLGTFFNNESSTENKTLRELLDADEYNAAAMSINSAYYTPASVIDSLWDAADKLGFNGGRILEGSAGIGSIIGAMPESISEQSSIEAVEIDSVSGNILKLLYPDAKVHIQGFQDTNIKNGSVDLAVTNVPFVTGLHVYDKYDKDLSKKFKNIHDFCIAKNIRKLREGGLGIFITSNGTLDKSRKLREWIIGPGSADVIGAFRLNNATFGGTNVTSDIIIVRKRIGNKRSTDAIDVLNTAVVRSGEYESGEQRWDKKLGQFIREVKTVVMEYNSYFQQHPENMAGEMAFAYEKGDTFRPGSVGLYPTKDKDQNTQLQEWIKTMHPIINVQESQDTNAKPLENQETTEKEGALVLNKNGELCVSQQGEAIPLGINKNKVKGREKTECLKDYNTIKSSLAEVLEYQIHNDSDNRLKPLLSNLNRAYDDFVLKYGALNRNTSISFLKNDVDFPSIAALEDYSESKTIDGKKEISITKTSVFNERVIGYKAEPEPKTVKDGVIASVYKFGNINTEYIGEKLQKSGEDVKNEILKQRLGFVNPITGGVEVRYEYLSGNVREKLELAKANNSEGEYNTNIEELEKVVPMDIPAHLIEFSLGSSWIDPQLYRMFLSEEFGITDSSIEHVAGTWIMKVKSGKYNEKNRQAGVYSERFSETIMGDELVDAALNNKTIAVKKTYKNHDGSTETVADKDATQACSTRISEIKDSFKEWARGKMQQDEVLAEKIMRVYNDKFNAIVPKSIDDIFLPVHFGGAAERINLYSHQKKAVVRGTTEPLMLAHEVGTGKTFTLISTAMEMRRIGTAKKPMIVVQNATVGQFVSEAKKLYPNAKILTLTDRDRTPEGRRAFYGKIKYSDWDIIVVPQSTFEMIPDSPERQLTFIRERIDDKLHALEAMQESGADESAINQVEKELTELEKEFASVASAETSNKKDAKGKAKAAENTAAKAQEQLDRRTDDVQYFDEMGVDAILIDEAHEYKRLGFSTAMTRGVKGIDPAGSKKAAGIYLKTRAVLEQNGWKNVIFATGTPISNTAAELWTFMKYLMPKDVMMANDIYYFDDFVRNFGNISQSLEFATNGKFKENTRFAAYINKPELIRLWASVSDTVLTKEVDYVNDKVPKMEDDKAQDIFLPQSDGLIDIMKAVRKKLDEFENMSGKEKRANSSIPLTMYGIAKRAAIDTRLVDKNAVDEPNSKTNKVVEETLRSLKETDSYKGTVAVFCDNQRRWDGNAVGFDLFEDIRQKLIDNGVPDEQIVVMKSGMSIPKKEKIFADVNAGNARVIIGNTQTLGTGVNIQERLHTLIHMDAPDRPMDYTQRNGRILRQGNLHRQWGKPVRILRFGVEDSLDVTSYQRLKTKAGFIDSIMDGKSSLVNNQENRTLEEEEEGLFDNPVAVLSGSQYALLKNQAEREYRKYANKKLQYEADQIYVTNKLRKNEGQIKSNQSRIAERKARLDNIVNLFPDGTAKVVTIAGKKCVTDAEIDAALRELVNKPINEKIDTARKSPTYKGGLETVRLSLDGVDVDVQVRITRESEYDNKVKGFRVVMHKNVSYSSEKLNLEDVPVSGGYVRNALDDLLDNVIPGRDDKESIAALEKANERMRQDNKLMSERKGNAFEYEKELKAAENKVEEYTVLMQKEMAEKEAKYADRGNSSDVDLSEGEEEDLRFRISDDIDADNQDNAIMQAANDMADSMNISVSMLHSIEDVKEGRAKRAIQKGKKVKGWYDVSTGEVVVYLPNIDNVSDAQATILHETVAHKGLRDLLGKDDFDKLCSNVFDVLPDNTRTELMRKYGDPLIAGDEYMASIAENGIDVSLWDKIKGFVRNAFLKIGANLKISDNDIRYLLWKSKNRLLNNDNSLHLVNKVAADAEIREKLGIGEYSHSKQQGTSMEAGEKRLIRFRETSEDLSSDGSIEQYENELSKQSFKAKEAYQDSMLALKKLQDVIANNSGVDLKSHEDAYTAENHLSSKNTAEIESYGEHFFRPIMEELGILINNGNTYDDIKRYVFSKHGLERNLVFAQRDARNAATEKYWKQKEAVNREYDEGKLAEDEYEEKMQELQLAEKEFFEQKYDENRLRDYSGLTSLTEDEENYEALAQDIIDNFERDNDVSALWRAINNATKETLKKTYESGLMSKSTYDKVSKQFDYYIPLRGWNEETASDVYEYLQSEVSPVNAAIKTAKGRLSLADDPFATIGNMAESNIFMSNGNLMKQRFMNMVLNHPSDLVSLSEAWYVKDNTTGDWILSVPDIKDNDKAEVIRQKFEEHEERMEQLAKNGEATKVKEGLNINYRISDRQAKEHMIVVKRNGKEYVMYVNGNPRAAQAINGMTNPNVNEHPVWKWLGHVNRELAANFTTRNPAFVVTNLSRDLIYSVSSTYAKEGTVYGNKFIRNIPKAMKIVARHLSGKGGDSVEDVYFKEYLANGGETGYANLKDVEAYKKFVKNEIGKITGKKDYFKYLKACASFFSLMNRWAENVSRFNAYMTSREMGRNVFDSVSEAKEVTVNFNKKGAGYKTMGFFGLTAGTFRELFLFFNAAVQSLNNFSKIAIDHKSGFIKMIGGFTTAGFIVPTLNALAISMFGGDDDDDYYNNLPEWVRRNNICVYAGDGKFVTIPLPIELRAFYGLGEMAYQEIVGKGHNGRKIAYDAINQITELLPINPLGSNGDIVSSFTPDVAKPFAQLIRNKDYTGRPIYKENNFNEYMPEWTKTYNGTSKWLKGLSEWANEITGGNKYKRGLINFNPAKIEHLFESYFGGMAKTINQTSNTLVAGIESAIEGEKSEDLIWRNAPILNRFVNDGGDDRTSFSKVNSRYYDLYDTYKDVKHQLNGYKKEISNGNFSYLDELSVLQNSKEYDVYKVFERYSKSMIQLSKLEKSFPGSNKVKRKEIESKVMDIKKRIVKDVDGE